MNNISKIRGVQGATDTPLLKNKVSSILGAGKKTNLTTVNPFLDNSGKLVNPYIDYQRVLNSDRVSAKAKAFIQQATGLTPSVEISPMQSKNNNSALQENGQRSNPISGNSGADNFGDNSASKNSIATAAKKYMGTPYVWGGESMAEGGMDCSGFVYNALKDAGYNVGRTTAQGYRSYGTSISKTNMQPGDLIFFGKNGKASHIGIYLGNGQMIHSAGGSKNTKSNPGKGVSVINVDHRKDFLEARRY